MDMVCYPFLSEFEYRRCGLNIVSEAEFTLFKEDIENPTKFAKKIAIVYQKSNQAIYDKMVGDVYITCRRYFEVIEEADNDNISPYSELRVYSNGVSISDIDNIVTAYF